MHVFTWPYGLQTPLDACIRVVLARISDTAIFLQDYHFNLHIFISAYINAALSLILTGFLTIFHEIFYCDTGLYLCAFSCRGPNYHFLERMTDVIYSQEQIEKNGREIKVVRRYFSKISFLFLFWSVVGSGNGDNVANLYDSMIQLEQLKRVLRYPAAPWLPILVIHIRSQVKTWQSQSYNFKKNAKNSNFKILQETLHATHPEPWNR